MCIRMEGYIFQSYVGFCSQVVGWDTLSPHLDLAWGWNEGAGNLSQSHMGLREQRPNPPPPSLPELGGVGGGHTNKVTCNVNARSEFSVISVSNTIFKTRRKWSSPTWHILFLVHEGQISYEVISGNINHD